MKLLKFSLTEPELKTIIEGLSELPYRQSAKLIEKIAFVSTTQEEAVPEIKPKLRHYYINGVGFYTENRIIDRKTLISLAGLDPEKPTNGELVKWYLVELEGTRKDKGLTPISYNIELTDSFLVEDGAKILISVK